MRYPERRMDHREETNNRSQKKGLRSRSKPQNNLRFTKGVNPNPMPRNRPRRGVSTVRVFSTHPLITARFCNAAHSKIRKTGLGGGRSNVRMLQHPKIQITHANFPKPTQTNSENQHQKNDGGRGGRLSVHVISTQH
jgi:hypothetical protein